MRVRRRLEVRDESGGIEATRYLEDPVVDLRVKILESKESARTEAPRVAEDATSGTDRTVDIGAGEVRVDADFAHDAAEFALEIWALRIVTQP